MADALKHMAADAHIRVVEGEGGQRIWRWGGGAAVFNTTVQFVFSLNP